jgi:hypothetical protein
MTFWRSYTIFRFFNGMMTTLLDSNMNQRTNANCESIKRNVCRSETLEKTRRKGRENRKNLWEQRFDRSPGTLIYWLKPQRRKTKGGNIGGEGKPRVGSSLCGCLQQLHPFLCQLREKQQLTSQGLH